MTKQKNGTWKVSEDEMRAIMTIMIGFFEGIKRLEELNCPSLANTYSELYREYSKKDEVLK